MAYDEALEHRIRQFFKRKRIRPEARAMMGGLCFMVKGKMCVGSRKAGLWRALARMLTRAHSRGRDAVRWTSPAARCGDLSSLGLMGLGRSRNWGTG